MKQRHARNAFGLLLLCASMARAQGATTLGGVVHDAATSRPVIGAIVTLGSPPDARTTRTDATGAFQFARLAPLTYQLNVRRLGFEPSNQTVTVSADLRLTIALNRLATLDTVRVQAARQGIYGVVATAKDLRPLPGAQIQVFGTSVGTATVDSTGQFYYAVRSPGSYVVRAKSDGLRPQTVSVTVREDDGVEVALLLDSAQQRGANALEMAYGDFRDRMVRRGNASAIVSRAELLERGNTGVVSALMMAHTFGGKTLRFSDAACVFVDGSPRPGLSANAVDTKDVEAVEVYTASSERSGTLQERWPRSGVCGSTGMASAYALPQGRQPQSRPRQSDVVRWIVIWLKH